MFAFYDPLPDAIAFLAARTPAERHAIARLLDPDEALAVLRWIATRTDCDGATVAMIAWRLWGVAPASDQAAALRRRAALLAEIDALPPRPARIAWDGREAWDGRRLIGGPGLSGGATTAPFPATLSGPFGAEEAEPALLVFLDCDYADDDIFDSLWRVTPGLAAAADRLAGRPAAAWMGAVDALRGSHADALHAWMIEQPDCPASVAGQIFWSIAPSYHAARALAGEVDDDAGRRLIDRILERWRTGSFAPCDIDIGCQVEAVHYRAILGGGADPLALPADLLDPPRGRARDVIDPMDDFAFWCAAVDIGGLVPRPRTAALAEWRRDRAMSRLAPSPVLPPYAATPGLLDGLFYGGPFTGAAAQVDRAWRQFNIVMAASALILLALMRGGAGPGPVFVAMMAAIGLFSIYMANARMGGARRLLPWCGGATALTFALAFLFRWVDTGQIA